MTSSGLRLDQAQIFPRHRGARERRDLGDIVGGRNLDHVHPDKGKLRQPTQDGLHLPGRETADFRRSGAGRKGRIEHVNVEAEVDRRVPYRVANARRHGVRPHLVRLERRNNRHTAPERPIMDLARHRRADSNLDHAARLDEPFLDGVVEHRAMPKRLPETVGPGIDVSIEMEERRRAVPVGQCAQQRQGNAVVAAERNEVLDLVRLSLDQRHAGRNVAESGGEIADVGDFNRGGINPILRMGAIHQHAACRPDGRWPEPGAAAIGGADVERNPGNTVAGCGIAAAGAEKTCRHRVGRGTRHGAPVTSSAVGAAKRNTAAATAQVQSRLDAPSANAVMERLSTRRSLIS